ncbi:uncharacterized protein H6S33_008373 [Morchella sextelata]|uniref:uncharacterized protein n=1 Tax=Morchella sextelata TaxID=1174677 RepID=UPI001D044F4D|nr:uncharacterized protein H6S33_008373 [Morchella sextelata]KAH0602723.1 hypothetical protein H6S33_008373 [Morchella sextelata]
MGGDNEAIYDLGVWPVDVGPDPSSLSLSKRCQDRVIPCAFNHNRSVVLSCALAASQLAYLVPRSILSSCYI